MSFSYDKAMILYEQKRYDLAQPLLEEHLADRPDDGEALAYLALCQMRCGKVKSAWEQAQRAVDAQPDHGTPHYALALVARKRKRYKEAFQSINTALRASPDNADYLAFLGLLHLDKKSHAEALSAAETGLGFSADSINCQNIRALALTGLGRPGPGREILECILRDNPHDALTLANLGWNRLHQHQWKEALDYFSRSLQEDAENDNAREGLLEALRAHNPIYGFLLKYFLWLSRFSESKRWAIVVAETVLHRVLEGAGQRYRALRPLISLLMNLWGIFSYLTWVGRPLANLWLCLNPYGRRLLKNEEILESILVGTFLALGGASYFAWKVLAWRLHLAWTVIFLTMVIPISSVFDCPSGTPRNIMGAYTTGLMGVGIYAVWQLYDAPLTGGAGFGLYATGLLVSRYLGIYLARREKDE